MAQHRTRAGDGARTARWARTIGIAAIATAAVTGCFPDPGATGDPTTTTTSTSTTTTSTTIPLPPIDVDDAQLTWAYSRYAQSGSLGSWSQVATGDDVVINWADGAAATGDAADAGTEFMFAQFDGGTGSIDPATGAGTITWDTGDWTLNAYQGSFGAPDETLSDPILDIEADGTGTLSFEVRVSAGLDGNGDPSPAVGPERHTAVTFDSLDELAATGLRATGDFAGRSYDPGDGTFAACEENGVVTGGSWPADWIDFIPAGLKAHYYSTGCGGKQLLKPPAPFSVRWDDEAPAVTRQPTLSSTSFALGATLSTSGATVAFTGSPTPDIQWQRSTDGVTWTDVAGATGSRHTLPLGAADNGARIRAVLDNGVGTPATTNVLGPITVAVTATTLSAISPGTVYSYPGGTATFASNVTGSPLPTYQWERSSDNGASWTPVAETSWTPRTGGVRSTLVITGYTLADHNTKVRLRGSNGVGPEVVTNPATLSVQFFAPTIAVPPSSATAFVGQGISFTANGIGAQPPATSQWQVSLDDGATWTNWVSPYSSGTAGSLALKGQDTTAALNGALFRLRASNAAGETFSAPAKLTLIQPSGSRRIVIVPNGPFDPSGPVTFEVLAEGFFPPATVTSNVSWLVTHSSKWQPGQPINTNGALYTTVAALPNLIGNAENGGMVRAKLTFAAGSFTETTGSYGVALVGTDANERYYDEWTPINLLPVTP